MSDAPPAAAAGHGWPAESCPVCGASRLQEIRCKVVCLNCRTIVQSCADLMG